jgi:hypothetical protein
MMIAGLALMISTRKRPEWLGGPRRRFAADETANAMSQRASRQSLGTYLIFAGAIFWLVGL